MSSKRYIIGAIVAAVAVVAVLVGISLLGGDDEVTGLEGAAAVKAELAGLPQSGNVIGDPDAPVEILEFGDISCPACKAASESTVPEVLDEIVKSGDAKMSFHPIAFINASSERGALGAEAAAEQDAMWSFVTLLYKNQGPESQPEWLSDKLMEQAVADLGLNVAQWKADYSGSASENAFVATERLAREKGVSVTPTFIVSGPRGEKVLTGAEDLDAIRAAVAEVGPAS